MANNSALPDGPDPYAGLENGGVSSGAGVTITPAPAPSSPNASSLPEGPDPYAQFDSAPTQSGTSPADQGARQPSLETLAESPFVGFNKGVADTLGAPVDAVNWGLGKLGLPTSDTPVMGSNFLKQSMGLIGANPDLHPPLTMPERILGSAGEGAASVMVPEAALGAAGSTIANVAPKTADFLESTFGSSKSVPAALGNAAVGAGAGIGSETANELPIPDSWKPLARMGGSLVGGGFGALGAQVPTVARQGMDAAGNFLQPMLKGGPEAIAGGRLVDAAGSRDTLSNALDDNPGSLVPGSQPTLAEQVQIPGVSALQHQVETQDGVAFQQRRAAQSQARVGTLRGVEPNGAPEDVASFLRAQLADLDQRATGDVAQQTGAAQAATGDLGGTQTPEFYGAQISGQVQPQIDAATAAARAANQDLGEVVTPEQAGAALREPGAVAAETARQQRNSLFDAIDPDGKLNVMFTPVLAMRNKLLSGIGRLDAKPTGEEAAIYSDIGNEGHVIPFNSLRGLDSRVTAAMSEEMKRAGRSPVWGRLSQLKSSISDAIGNAAENQIAYERQAVQQGLLQPEQTMEARLAKQAGEFVAAKRQAQTASNSGESPFWDGTGGPSAVSGARGATGKANRGSGNPPSDQGISPPPLEPNFDEATAERYRVAKDAHAAYAQTFKQGPVGNMLRTNGFAGQYKLIDSGVPSTVFVPGQKGYETAMAYRQAVGDAPSAVNALRNYAAMSARRAAERPDGTLDPKKFGAWRLAHNDALRAVPEIRPQFSRVDQASRELQRFAPFRPDLAPSAIPEMFFHSGPSGAEGVRQLRGLVGDRQANSILTDYAASRLKHAAMRDDGTLDPAKTATWLKGHDDALGEMPGLKDRFSTVAKATQAVDDAEAMRKASIDAYQQGVVGKLLKVSDPNDVTRTVGGIFGQKNAVQEMSRLVQSAKGNPDAIQGIRKGIVDHMDSSFIGNTENIKADAFQTFLRKNHAALATVFKPEELKTMGAVAADLARTRIAFEQARIPGQSTTAPDLAAAKKAEAESGHGHGLMGALGHSSLLAKIAAASWAALEVGGEKAAVAAAIGTLGSHVIGAMRGAGLKTADDLVKQALLNETGDGALAKALMMKAPIKPNVGSEVTLAHQLRRVSVMAAGNTR